jgi:hypothetical protein
MEEKTWRVLSSNGRLILKCILKEYDYVVKWIQLAKDNEMRRALVNTVINFRLL